jgi:hypothetical protein
MHALDDNADPLGRPQFSPQAMPRSVLQERRAPFLALGRIEFGRLAPQRDRKQRVDSTLLECSPAVA